MGMGNTKTKNNTIQYTGGIRQLQTIQYNIQGAYTYTWGIQKTYKKYITIYSIQGESENYKQ